MGDREARAIAANLGRDARATRRKRRLTQQELGQRVGLGQSEISHLERGNGARTAIAVWVSLGIALDRPIAVGFSRDVADPLDDAPHLAAQELVVRRATAAGWRASFEVSAGRSSLLSTDLVLQRKNDTVFVEIWNRIDDLGAAVRSSDRKLAAAAGTPKSLWLLFDTAANRAITRRYPAILAVRFGGSSARWIRALDGGGPMPVEPGAAWIDLRAETLRAMRPTRRLKTDRPPPSAPRAEIDWG